MGDQAQGTEGMKLPLRQVHRRVSLYSHRRCHNAKACTGHVSWGLENCELGFPTSEGRTEFEAIYGMDKYP